MNILHSLPALDFSNNIYRLSSGCSKIPDLTNILNTFYERDAESVYPLIQSELKDFEIISSYRINENLRYGKVKSFMRLKLPPDKNLANNIFSRDFQAAKLDKSVT